LCALELLWIFVVSLEDDFIEQFSKSGLLIALCSWFEKFFGALFDDRNFIADLPISELCHKVWSIVAVIADSSDYI
jgi:hypothetical protein